MIPPNDPQTHLLPVGIHKADSWDEVVERFGYSPVRLKMLEKLHDAITFFLKDFGCKRIFLDGSFLKDNKPVPGDYDVVWDDTGLDLDKCNIICSTFFKFGNECELQKREFKGEFFSMSMVWNPLDFFQQDNRRAPILKKGIVEINIEVL